jgi:hypothetical protein
MDSSWKQMENNLWHGNELRPWRRCCVRLIWYMEFTQTQTILRLLNISSVSLMNWLWSETDKSSPGAGQNHLPSCQQGEACHDEKGGFTFHLVSAYYYWSCSDWIWLLQEAILVNCSRGPVIDEAALVEHLKENPMFRVGLDVFEVLSYTLWWTQNILVYLWELSKCC